MKKAYVKPVFLAEEFVAETSYATMICNPNSRAELEVIDQQYWCDTHVDSNCSYQVSFSKGDMNKHYGGTWNDQSVDDNFSYYDYATAGGANDKAYLFNRDNVACDFLWNGDSTDSVYAYTTVEKKDTDSSKWFNLGSLSKFFFGNGSIHANEKGHSIGYMGAKMHSI